MLSNRNDSPENVKGIKRTYVHASSIKKWTYFSANEKFKVFSLFVIIHYSAKVDISVST